MLWHEAVQDDVEICCCCAVCVQIFGDSKAVEKAVAMIEEVVSNKKQKEKQRQAQYERKRDQKRRER